MRKERTDDVGENRKIGIVNTWGVNNAHTS
jgi:hypothetical protein